ncbi:MAG: tetratricopeptide repeat protein, partial [Planctomycetaceae bacterium]|nr:tetratricopeptide repeat protein [Planctomycetaceae bacterium]
MCAAEIDYQRSCFVIMPFGRKPVGDKEVDFNFIYQEVFVPAIRATPLTAPETGYLEPRRTDQDFFSGLIDLEMFRYLEYSRFAPADISGLNANVLYELGVRHRADPAGTAIFRQAGTLIPFDIKAVKAFEYSYEPMEEVARSRELITRVLTESLKYNRPDSPVRVALDAQGVHAAEQTGGRPVLDEALRAAENALRGGKKLEAIALYREAVRLAPDNTSARMKLGLLLKDLGRWEDALAEFREIARLRPDYAEALREQGIAENKLYERADRPPGTTSGEESLRRAIHLSPEDYDALSSLGGA